MSQSTKRPSLSEASEASEASQPILNSTDSESDKNDDEPPPAYAETIPSQSNDGVTTTGLNPAPELPKTLKAGDTLTQHHDSELSDIKDDPPQSQCTEQPASGEESVPEIKIAPSANRAMIRSPKRSSFPDASDALPKPKRHEREPPSDELESLQKPHITLPPPGRDMLATEELGLLPDLCGGDDKHAPKQTFDPPAGSDSSGAGSHPRLASKLSSAPHLPPLIDEGAAPGEPTSPSHPSLSPELPSTPHSLPLADEGATPGEPTSSSLPVQTHTNDLASEEDQAQRRLQFMTYDTLMKDENAALPGVWSRFKAAVEAFALRCLPSKCSWDELPTAYQVEVRKWASDPQYYLNSKFSDDVAYFYAAWLFRLLNDHLFSGEDLDKWDGPDWRSFGTIWASGKAHLNEPNGLFAVKYHHWRNLSVQTLADMHPERRHVDPLWLRKKIEDWMEDLPFASETEQVEDNWKRLIESAIDMDSLIITARRDIQLRLSDSATHKHHSFPLIESKMAHDFGSKAFASEASKTDRVVEFVIFPTLLAYGQVKSRTYGFQDRPAESVLCPFGSSWDKISEEIKMLVYCG